MQAVLHVNLLVVTMSSLLEVCFSPFCMLFQRESPPLTVSGSHILAASWIHKKRIAIQYSINYLLQKCLI